MNCDCSIIYSSSNPKIINQIVFQFILVHRVSFPLSVRSNCSKKYSPENGSCQQISASSRKSMSLFLRPIIAPLIWNTLPNFFRSIKKAIVSGINPNSNSLWFLHEIILQYIWEYLSKHFINIIHNGIFIYIFSKVSTSISSRTKKHKLSRI